MLYGHLMNEGLEMADWDGKGLPPIGVKCEMMQVGGENEPWGTWIRAEILARADGYIFCRVMVDGDNSYPEMIREDRYKFCAIQQPVDPRRAVIYTAIRESRAAFNDDQLKTVIDAAIAKLDDLPPF